VINEIGKLERGDGAAQDPLSVLKTVKPKEEATPECVLCREPSRRLGGKLLLHGCKGAVVGDRVVLAFVKRAVVSAAGRPSTGPSSLTLRSYRGCAPP
jgi:hypothetical protein